MNTTNLHTKIGEYTEVLENAKTAKTQWQEETINLIKTSLNGIVDRTNLDWFVDENASMINHETIILAFGAQPSGISYNPEDAYNKLEEKSGLKVKEGGTLNFSLLNTGKVYVWVTYPFIPDVVEESDHFHVKSYWPHEIREREVVECVETFVQEMKRWEVNDSKGSPVGYKIGKALPTEEVVEA